MPAKPLELPDGWEKVSDDGHLIKKIVKEGSGFLNPENGSKVEVHYTGRLVSNGEQFDSSRDRGEPFTFNLGSRQVIKGWDEGIPTMKKGEQAIFRMSSDYGYGEAGSGAKIPGGADLEFDVELLDWNSKEDITNGKKGILKKVITKGEGYEKPNDCTKVAVAFKLFLEENIIEEYNENNLFHFTVGEEQVFEGFEKAVRSMNSNEVSMFEIKPEWGYGENGCEDKNIPPNAELKMEIKLVEMEKEKETWKLNNQEKIEFAAKKKLEGNSFFKQGKYKIACKRYEMGLNAVKYCSDWEEKEKLQAEDLQVVLNNNTAAIKSKEKNWKDVIKYTEDALKIRKEDIKALYRKGVALSETGDWMQGEKIFQQVLEIDPNNKEVKRELLRLKKRQKAQNEKDRKMFQRMFQ